MRPLKRVIGALLLGSALCAFSADQPTSTNATRKWDGLQSRVSALSGESKLIMQLRLAQIYGRTDRGLQKAELRQIFSDALQLESESLQAQYQGEAVRQLAIIAPDQLPELIPLSVPSVRSTLEAAELDSALRTRGWGEALRHVDNLAHLPQFPYLVAIRLIDALPAERSQDVVRVFTAALSSAELDEASRQPGLEDIGTLLLRYRRRLPKELIDQAVDQLLAQAKKESASEHPVSMTLFGKEGQANFTSTYQFRLFELVPLLREIDPSRAEKLEQESPNLAAVLKSYPDGLASLDDAYQKVGQSPRSQIRYTIKGSTPQSPDGNSLRKLLQEIGELAAKDPAASLLKCDFLPLEDAGPPRWSPRANAYGEIIDAQRRKDPAATEAAFRKLDDTLPKLSPLIRAEYLGAVARVRMELRQDDDAWAAIQAGLGTVKDLYKSDRDSDDPNQSAKARWPTAVVARNFIFLATKLHPEAVAPLLDAIPDPEIRTMAEIAQAEAESGLPPLVELIDVKKKNDGLHQMFAPPK